MMTECSDDDGGGSWSKPETAIVWPSGENPKPPKTRPLTTLRRSGKGFEDFETSIKLMKFGIDSLASAIR